MSEPEPHAVHPPSSVIRWTLIALILVGAIVAYWPAIHAGYIWDDDDYVINNPVLRDLDGLCRIWIPRETPQYYPAVFTTFWVEYQLWGLKPTGYHVVNVLLHAVNALLVWGLANRLRIPGAWLIGAVFALHPVHVESVAWITERKNVLSGFFYLLAAIAYLRFDDDRTCEAARGRTWRVYGLSLALFLLALLSKSVTCSLPAALILMMLWQRKRLTLKRLGPLVPMFLLGLALGLNTAMLERDHVKAIGPDFDFSILDRCLIASKALLFYPWKIVWPSKLIFIYPRWAIDDSNAASYWSIGMVVLIGAGALFASLRGWRGPALALLFFAGTIFPALGFLNVYPMIFSFVADHFQYLASLGIIVLVVGGFAWIVRRDAWLVLPAVLILPLLGWLTWRQSAIYYSHETLWNTTVARNDSAWIAHNNLVPILLKQSEDERLAGRLNSAERLLKQAREHAERAYELKRNHPPVLSNLSEARRCDGAVEQAIEPLLLAIELVPKDPNYRWQLGRLNESLRRNFEALDAYGKAVELDPQLILFRASLASLLMRRNEHAQAIGHLRFIESQLEENPAAAGPGDAMALESLARVFAEAGQMQPAAEAQRSALSIAQRLGMTNRIGRMQRRLDDYDAGGASQQQ